MYVCIFIYICMCVYKDMNTNILNICVYIFKHSLTYLYIMSTHLRIFMFESINNRNETMSLKVIYGDNF